MRAVVRLFQQANGKEALRLTVYADEAFLLNGLIDYLLLLCGAKLSGDGADRRRLLLAALLGGLYGAAALVPALGFLQLAPIRAASLAAMVLLAYGVRRRTLRTGLLFLAATCAFAGLAFACTQLFGTGVLLLPGGVYYPVSFPGLVLLASLAYLACSTIFACTAQHGGGEVRTLRLSLAGRSAPVRALCDTGCTLRDPVTGERALVAEAELLQTLLPGAHITAAELAEPASLLLRLHTAQPQLAARLLHYRAVGTQSGLLLALRCGLTDEKGRETSCLTAFSPTPVSDDGSYHALIGGKL